MKWQVENSLIKLEQVCLLFDNPLHVQCMISYILEIMHLKLNLVSLVLAQLSLLAFGLSSPLLHLFVLSHWGLSGR